MRRKDILMIIFQMILLLFLLFALFVPNMFSRSLFSVILLISAIGISFFSKKIKITSIKKKNAMIILIILALVYVALLYLLGFYFGFLKVKTPLSVWSFFRFILPLTIIIISSEILRKKFLFQETIVRIKSLRINISLILTYIIMVLIDLKIYTGIYDLTNLNDFLTALGFVFFGSVSCNLLYNYLCVRYDCKAIIIYRLITTLYMYIIPVVPDIYMFFQSFYRMVFPYIVYVVFDKIYINNVWAKSRNARRRDFFGNTIFIFGMVLVIMLVSCQFYYGILVIGSKSMTGTIDKGDAIIFEKYDKQTIAVGQIILFDYNGTQTVHRVDEIINVNGVTRYYTKGDANKERDYGYITGDKIYGIVKLKLKYIGYPTLWVRSLFS